MSSVLGIDLSTKAIDLVRLDETTNRADWTRIELEGKSAFDRLRHLPLMMRHPAYGLDFDDVYLAAIEAPMSRGQSGTLAKLSRVFGAVVACLPPALEVWEVAPAAWRKELGLSGHASKEEVARSVRSLMAVYGDTTITFDFTHPCFQWPQDALDAYAIAYYARQVNARGVAA